MLNSNVVLGYGIDADAIYGPSAHKLVTDKKESEPGNVTDASIQGPTNRSTPVLGNLSDAKVFFASPVGMLLVLVPLAYLAFKKVF